MDSDKFHSSSLSVIQFSRSAATNCKWSEDQYEKDTEAAAAAAQEEWIVDQILLLISALWSTFDCNECGHWYSDCDLLSCFGDLPSSLSLQIHHCVEEKKEWPLTIIECSSERWINKIVCNWIKSEVKHSRRTFRLFLTVSGSPKYSSTRANSKPDPWSFEYHAEEEKSKPGVVVLQCHRPASPRIDNASVNNNFRAPINSICRFGFGPQRRLLSAPNSLEKESRLTKSNQSKLVQRTVFCPPSA